jgi:CDP-glucose 4,6-dehydratase
MRRARGDFWRGKRVLVTGHTGFKGAWLCLRLLALGAEVTGLALDPPTDPALFRLARLASDVNDVRVDLRDAAAVSGAVLTARPEVVFHLAAQALVRPGLDAPLDTLDVNVMGSARLFEALRRARPAAVIAVTSDKVYLNKEVGRAFREDDPLGGSDPYSGSKSAAELIARIWRESFGLPLVAARAGNVVGGGDFAAGRLLPDVGRALAAGEPLVLRRPQATRPWSHVLDVAEGYLLYAEALAEGRAGLPEALNFGPAPGAAPISVLETATLFARTLGETLNWRADPDPFPEKTELAIDSTLARDTLGWSERFPGAAAVAAAADWRRRWRAGEDPRALCDALVGAA